MRAHSRPLVGIGLVLLVAGCGGASASPAAVATAEPTATSTVEPTPTPNPAAAILGECADAPAPEGEPVVLAMRTTSSGFDTDRLEGPRHCEPFVIELKNADTFADHNVAIEPMDQIGLQLFSGDLVPAPSTVSYDIPALPAGEYRFVCSPHRESMRGTLVVSP